MQVTIPKITEHCGYVGNLVTIEISDNCPKCGAKRGVKRWEGLSYDGSRRLNVDCWANECGHIDKYSEVIREYYGKVTPLEYLYLSGFIPNSDLNFCTDSGIEYYIGYKGTEAAIVALIEDENTYLLPKPELREMSWTAKVKGIDKVTLFTNYGVELHSKYEKPQTVGFDKIEKILLPIGPLKIIQQ